MLFSRFCGWCRDLHPRGAVCFFVFRSQFITLHFFRLKRSQKKEARETDNRVCRQFEVQVERWAAPKESWMLVLLPACLVACWNRSLSWLPAFLLSCFLSCSFASLLCFAWLGFARIALLCFVWLGLALLCFDLLSRAWLCSALRCSAGLCYALIFLACLLRVAFWSIRSSGLLRWFCVTGAALRMTWQKFFSPHLCMGFLFLILYPGLLLLLLPPPPTHKLNTHKLHTHTNLTHNNFTYTNVTYNNFTHTNFTHTNLTYNNFTYTNFTHTNLTHTQT